MFGRGGGFDKPFKWTYGHLLGLEQVCASMVDIFDKTPTNKKVAFLAMNNADGQAWLDENTGAPPYLEAAGYTIVAPGLFTPGGEDFTAQISQFKKEGCEVLTGASNTPDFTNFWKQSLQQGFKPPVAEPGPGPRLSAGRRGHRAERVWTYRSGRLVAPHLPLHRLGHGNDLPGAGGRLREGHDQRMDGGDR